ncbi:MAG: 3-phosphoshikimate 1-carboxyvinyltransferase [Actinomycetota bacterium]
MAVPGDKSIAHRWLILAATAQGSSRLLGVPASLDVRSTASCLSSLSERTRPGLEAWSRNDAATAQGHGSTWNGSAVGPPDTPVEVEGEGWAGLHPSGSDLDCGNSGTAMRLLAGVAAGSPFRSVLTGDASLSSRPMERVAEPLRAMGASVATHEGHAPLTVEGGHLQGITYDTPVPTAQVKSAILLAGLTAAGPTTVRESAPTRDHTEIALEALGVPIDREANAVTIRPFQHGGIEGRVPGDPSSAAFLVGAAALTGSDLTISEVGLNPSRIHFLEVMARMGVRTECRVERVEMGEPVGEIWVAAGDGVRGTQVRAEELPLVIDEVPILAIMASLGQGETRLAGAGELRVKESDRLGALVREIGSLGGSCQVEGDDLVVAGGVPLGGAAHARGDHRMAMALVVAALPAGTTVEVDDVGAADVSFPGFLQLLRSLGASIEVIEP